jgi:hypothetical protein
MKNLLLFLSVLILSGCTTTLVKVKDPNNLTTREIYEVLKYESIKIVGTTHSNHVGITLADGRTYRGIYNPHDIPRFGKDTSLHPASNFVIYMRKQRTGTTWDILCE